MKLSSEILHPKENAGKKALLEAELNLEEASLRTIA
jgi:hypothetical protein